MPRASRRAPTCGAGSILSPGSAGFSLAEVLVAGVVLAIALAGSSVALQGITSLLGRSGQLNAMNLAIDNDISEIKRLASLYSACLVSTGSIPSGASAGCGQGLRQDQAAYFFPLNPGVDEANINAFFAACKATSAASHITQGFITAINGLPAVGAGVTRSEVVREAPTDPKNHTVIVRYAATDASMQSAMQRVIKVAPVVSAWCD